jgi:hypothetical protein
MMSDTNTGESVKHLPEPDGTKEIAAHFLHDGRAGQHFEQDAGASSQNAPANQLLSIRYFENAADGLLGVDPPGPVATTTA